MKKIPALFITSVFLLHSTYLTRSVVAFSRRKVLKQARSSFRQFSTGPISMEFVHQINKPKEYIQKIYDVSVHRNVFSIYATGGGITSLQWLFTTAGASKCLKSGEIPYSRAALKGLIEEEDSEPITSYCSLDIAMRLAEKAYRTTVENLLKEEADVLSSPHANIFGVGCTAALATSNPMKGDHRCYIAIHSPKSSVTYSVVMDKEVLSRDEEDIICSNFILHLIGQYCQLPPYLHLQDFEQKLFRYETSAKTEDLPSLIQKTLDRKRSTIIFPSISDPEVSSWKSVEKSDLPSSSLVFPGSFNPLHIGHLRLIQKAVEKIPSFSGLLVFEIAAINADKPPLATEEIIRRLNQFFLDHQSEEFQTWLREKKYVIGVAITSTPMFIQKSFLFPNSYFLIGADTLERLLEPRYYRDPKSEINDDSLVTGRLIQSISNIYHNGCKFIIGGRIEQRKGAVIESNESLVFQTLGSVVESSQIARIISQLFPSQFFQQIHENEFREDISSSQIRKNQSQNR